MLKAVPVCMGGAMLVFCWSMAEDLLKLGKRCTPRGLR